MWNKDVGIVLGRKKMKNQQSCGTIIRDLRVFKEWSKFMAFSWKRKSGYENFLLAAKSKELTGSWHSGGHAVSGKHWHLV